MLTTKGEHVYIIVKCVPGGWLLRNTEVEITNVVPADLLNGVKCGDYVAFHRGIPRLVNGFEFDYSRHDRIRENVPTEEDLAAAF